jgi:hypothetical protein
LVARSVTTSRSPPGEKDTWAGWVAEPLNGRVDPARGSRSPSSTVNPVMLPVPPALSTYTRSPWTARLVGRVPPEATTSTNSSPPGTTRKALTESLPAFTAKT